MFYVRLTRQAKDVYLFLEEYLEDRRKLKQKTRTGTRLTYVDQFVDDLLTKERVCATTLWKMPKREVLEDLEVLEARISPLGDIEDLLDSDVEEVREDVEAMVVDGEEGETRSQSGSQRSRSRTRSRSRSRSHSRSQRSYYDDSRSERSYDGMDVDKEDANGKN